MAYLSGYRLSTFWVKFPCSFGDKPNGGQGKMGGAIGVKSPSQHFDVTSDCSESDIIEVLVAV